MTLDYGHTVLNGAAELFRSYGIKSISMYDIAKSAGVSKSSLYKEFGGKDEIIMNLSSRFFKAMQDEIDQIDKDEPPEIEFVKIVKHCMHFFLKHDSNLLFEIKTKYPEVWKAFLHHRDVIVAERLQKNIERGVNDGSYMENFNVELIVKLYIEQLQLVFTDWVYPKGNYQPQELFKALLRNQLFGIAKAHISKRFL